MAKWIIDSLHSDVHFKVRHLVISSVTGEFRKFEGTVETTGNNFASAKIRFFAETASVDTNNEKRDADLRALDFFDSEKFPRMEFESTGFEPVEGDEYILRGNLTVKGGTGPVELKVHYGGTGKDIQGHERAGFEISGLINRAEFGLVWSRLTESGAIILGEDVKVHCNIELVKDTD